MNQIKQEDNRDVIQNDNLTLILIIVADSKHIYIYVYNIYIYTYIIRKKNKILYSEDKYA